MKFVAFILFACACSAFAQELPPMPQMVRVTTTTVITRTNRCVIVIDAVPVWAHGLGAISWTPGFPGEIYRMLQSTNLNGPYCYLGDTTETIFGVRQTGAVRYFRLEYLEPDGRPNTDPGSAQLVKR